MAFPSDPSARVISTTTPARTGSSRSFVDVAVEKQFCTAEQIVGAMAEYQRENPGLEPGETLASFLVRKSILSVEADQGVRTLAARAEGHRRIRIDQQDRPGRNGFGFPRAAVEHGPRRCAEDSALRALRRIRRLKTAFCMKRELSAKFNHSEHHQRHRLRRR